MNRRDLFARSALLAAGTAAGRSAKSTEDELVDTNVTLGDWVVRRSWADSPATLIARLRRHGVTSAWAASSPAIIDETSAYNATTASVAISNGSGSSVSSTDIVSMMSSADDIRKKLKYNVKLLKKKLLLLICKVS